MARGSEEYNSRYDSYTSEEYPPDWQDRRQKVLKRDGYVCQGCSLRSTRVDDIRFDVDHIVPKSDGGSHSLKNLQTLCRSCHASKHPRNQELKSRGQRFNNRNRASLLVRFVRLLLSSFVSSIGLDDEIVLDGDGRRLRVRSLREAAALNEGSGVTVTVIISELWDNNSDAVQQLGRVRDASIGSNAQSRAGQEAGNDGVRFVVWSGDGHQRLSKGGTYRFVGAKTNRYNGSFQLVVDGQTDIQPRE